MNQGKTFDSDPAGGDCADMPVAREKPDGVTINFQSAEFNRIDDLNDCSGNYRSFESLDGVVTAHECHQREISSRKDNLDPSRVGPARPRRNKPENDESDPMETTAPLTVISEGRTLIIDTDAERARACGKTLLEHRLSCTLLVTGSTLPAPLLSGLSRIKLLHADRVSVTGAFGGFSAKVTGDGIEKPLTEWIDDAAVFDLVLDLQAVPSFAGGRLPIGYYAPGPSPAALDEAMAELPEMRGQFQKPQFVVLNRSRCFHGRSRTQDCHRCVEICPLNAVRSVDRGILINHYVCQGCGGCALACPANAIRLVQPSQDQVLIALRSSLAGKLADGVSPISLMISDSEPTPGNGHPGRNGDLSGRICFKVEQIAYVRLEMLLAAIAYGATEVLVACDPRNPSVIREAVEWQVKMARAVVQGLDPGEERIRFLAGSPEDLELTEAVLPRTRFGELGNDTALPTFSSCRDARTLVHLLARYLHDRSGVQKPWVPLPAGSPFGTVTVNSDACTLCMACVAACPSGALSPGDKAPRLAFREPECHQCGLCQETCPEDAIRRVPRLLLGRVTTEGETVLREAEPFRCVECGVPFAPPAMIDRIKAKLAGHWMYANERQLRRLQMCGTCRTRDALTSREMEPWNP